MFAVNNSEFFVKTHSPCPLLFIPVHLTVFFAAWFFLAVNTQLSLLLAAGVLWKLFPLGGIAKMGTFSSPWMDEVGLGWKQLPAPCRLSLERDSELFQVLCSFCLILGGSLLIFPSILHLLRLELWLGSSLELCFGSPRGCVICPLAAK